MKILAACLLGWITSMACAAAPRYTTVRVDVQKEHLELFWGDDAGKPLHRHSRLASWLSARGRHLRFAMNAGMYHADFTPVGVYVNNSQAWIAPNLASGTGNFFLKPNGVFFVNDAGAHIVESSEYPALSVGVRLATQSGPLLVRHGVIHPRFDAHSTSRKIRNAVGVSGGEVIFAISDTPVTFFEMALYFRDVLNCADALYLDGTVSSLYSDELRRNDDNADLGPIIGVTD
ncbi:MAG: phosphodiester glycosidase family protein [Tahibacter sp.]